jgi:tetratricopeptide (TPR) repeat protein
MEWSTRSRTELARGALCLLMATCVALLPYAAHAGPAEDAKAKALFKDGEKEYNGGNFQAALEKYQQAYDLSPLPGFLFNEAQCYRQLGNFERASFMYGRFIDLSKPKAPNVEMAAKLRTEMDEKQAEKIAADKKAADEAEAKRVADAKAAEDAKAKDAPLATNLTPPPPVDLTPPPPPPEEKPVYKSGVFWTLVIVGALAVAGGVTAGVLVAKNQGPQQPPPLSMTTLPNIDAR